jgi:hypothetical protein
MLNLEKNTLRNLANDSNHTNNTNSSVVETGCKENHDCLNCTSSTKEVYGCTWNSGNCEALNRQSLPDKWFNKFSTCIADNETYFTMYNFCGEAVSNISVVDNRITLKNHNKIYAPPNLYCKWSIPSINLQKMVNFYFELNYFNPTSDKYTFIIEFDIGKMYYSDVTESKEFKTNDISTITLHFYTQDKKNVQPFTFDFSYDLEDPQSNSLMVYLILSIASICGCLFLGVCVYTCVKSVIDKIFNSSPPPSDNQTVPANVNTELNNKECVAKLFDLNPLLYQSVINEYGCICTICLENFIENTEVVKLECKHLYHFTCLSDYLTKNPQKTKCPNCNNSITPNKMEKITEENLHFIRGTSDNNNEVPTPQQVNIEIGNRGN